MIATSPSAAEGEATFVQLSFRKRLLLWMIVTLGSFVVRLLGATLRYETSSEAGGSLDAREKPMVWAFWHQCLVIATHRFRDRDIAVLTSLSFDGEIISRIIEKFGYQPVRGSSRRGGLGAILGARREIENGRAVAFTVDGPLGPPYEAKLGPVMLAKMSGVPIIAFHITPQRAWALRTWDRMLLPKPFSRVVVRFSTALWVSNEADDAEMERCRLELQRALERVRDCAEKEIKNLSAR